MNEALKTHNFAEYFKYYIGLAEDNEDVINALENTHQQTNDLLDLTTEDQGNYTYAEGKWTVKELLVHLIDMERIFCNRALRISRNDKTDLPGYDHDEYVKYSEANERKLCDICKEYNLVRQGTIQLFKSFNSVQLEREGTANSNQLTVLAIGFIIAGHEIHHINVLNGKYLS